MKDEVKVHVQGLHNVELEQQLLGAILTNNDTFTKVAGLVEPIHFWEPTHARIWEACARRHAAEQLFSPITLRAEFENDEGLKELGGPAYLARLAGAAIGASFAATYAKEMIELFNRRQLHEMLLSHAEELLHGGRADDAKASIEVGLQAVETDSGAPRSTSFLAASTDAVSQIVTAYESGRAGISTGLQAIDEMTGGLVKQDFIIIAGDTSMGKTSVATYIAHHVAKNGYGVGFASLEMSEAALAMRINSIESGTAYQRMRNGQISEGEFRNLVETAKAQEALPIQIYNSSVRTIPAILSEAKRTKAFWKPQGDFKGMGLLIVDYIQLIQGPGGSIYEKVTEISRQMKAMAKVLDLPVIGLAQLSRGFKQRDNKRPQLADLKDSSQLEQDADEVIFCYREEYYLDREEPPKDTDEMADFLAAKKAVENVMELIVAKQRMGPVGKVKVGCDIKTNRLWNLTEQGGFDL